MYQTYKIKVNMNKKHCIFVSNKTNCDNQYNQNNNGEGVTMKIAFKCPHCNHKESISIPFAVYFFVPLPLLELFHD